MNDMPQEAKRRMCFSKKRYTTQTAAINATIGSSRSFGKPLRFYKCPLCGKWHVSSSVRD
jgi:formate dehydrogenase maturation protein FdhE